MRARAVIGANFGDEGKGLMTDFLCSHGADVVVRFNGGANAGHTVVTPAGDRHVFKHVGSGTFQGVPTYLSEYFVCNPILFMREMAELSKINMPIPQIFAHPMANVTTFADMIINQRLEDARGNNRHGSVGVGLNETVNRSKISHLRLTMMQLWDMTNTRLEQKLHEMCNKWAEFRTGSKITERKDAMIAEFIREAYAMAAMIQPGGMAKFKDPVFEGAQGLLLDSRNAEMYPHVTRSRTGLHNVRTLCAQAGIADIDAYYVSRTYLTRHGAGPLPGEDPALAYPDDTNLEHPYQGKLRFAPLDFKKLMERVVRDAQADSYYLCLTHCDQLPSINKGDIESHGPTRNDVKDTE